MPKKKNVGIEVNLTIPAPTFNKLVPMLQARGIGLEQLILLYLRSLVTASEKSRALTLESEMPFGKYKGEQVELIIRAEPKYIQWLISESTNVTFDSECLELLQAVITREAQFLEG